MDPRRVRNLLLVLLIPLSDQNLQMNSTAEPHHSSRSVEFCLHVPGESHWSSSEPDKPTPTKTAHPPTTGPPKQQTAQPKAEPEPAQTSWGSTQPVTSADPAEEPTTRQAEAVTEPQLVTEENIVPEIYHGPLRSARGCRCDGKNIKLPTETSPVRRTEVWPPTEHCRSPEFLEMLQDGREVCVTAHSFLTYFSELVRSQQNKPSTTVPPPTTAEPTTQLPTTTQPNVPQCEFCTSDLENITAEAVQSLSVKMRSFPCKTLIYINLKDDNGSLCVDEDHVGFQRLLENLGTLPSFPPDVNTTVNKCRCRDTDVISTNEGQSAVIWFPSDTCNSTEYIQTLMDGSELCVTPPSLLFYFYSIRDHHRVQQTASIQEAGFVIDHVEIIEIMCWDLNCPTFDLESISSKDVELLQMDVQSPNCPIYLHVHLKRQEGRPDYFCVSSEEPQFPDVLKKVDIN